MIKKFGMLMVLGALFGGIVLAGCGGNSEEAATPNAAGKDKTPKDEEPK